MPRCAACGTEAEAGAQFCDACGAALPARGAEDAVARKVVTVVFADVVGSTSLQERLDAESVRRVMDGYYRALRAAVDAHGGTVVKLLGDGVMAAFGVPRVTEDDALRAVRAAVAMQRAFAELAGAQRETVGDVGLRVGVNTGEVVVRGDHDDVVGDPVNVAARLQQEAPDGEVLVGEATRRLVGDVVTLEPFGSLALRGRAGSVAAYRVVSLERPAGVAAIPFVGRDDELRRLTDAYEGAVDARVARLAVVLGSPGLGKSRLVGELARRLDGDAAVLVAHCDAAGGATFAPIAEALRAHLRLDPAGGVDATRAAVAAPLADDPERQRIAAGIGALLAGAPAPPEETFFVVRRLLTALAAARPVVLVIDDLQWAEPLLLDLTEHLVQWSADAPLLVLVAARPELRDLRPALTTPGRLVSDVVTLGGLDAAAATRLAASVIGADALPASVAGRVLATSEGNPLFLGELVRMLVHDGALVRDGARWTVGTEVAALEMPPTIHALLAARIERLAADERTVLERAAIVGRQFSRTAVAHLLPAELATELEDRLEALRRSELIEPDVGRFLGEPALRFHHMLIRDAAYRRVLKETRAELHGRFADWVASRPGDAVEHDETIGRHLEQAHQHLRELGPLDATGRAVGERAARHLAAAGRRALARDDLPLAANLLGRAVDRLESADPARADLALDWCEALLSAGDVVPAAVAVDELARFTDGSDRLRAWHTCFAGQLAALTDPEALRSTADAASDAAGALAAVGDAAGEAKAHSIAATALARLGKMGACEVALDRALAAARRAHDRRRATVVLAGAPPAALWGPSPVARASGRCLDVVRVLRITQGAPAVEAVALRCQGVIEALRGRTDAAERMIASSRRMVEELGLGPQLLESDVFAAMVELLQGNAVAAEALLRGAYAGFREQGLRIDAAQAAALLGRALLAQDRAAEAEAISHESESLAGDDLKAASAWRGVRAEALARRGETVAAVECARAAVAIAAGTDALLDHADARWSYAATLRAAGRPTEADAEEERAIELWEAKGATWLAERTRAARGDTWSRSEEGVGVSPMSSAPGRRVNANAATANAARMDAAVAARDLDALFATFAEGAESLHHSTGAVYQERTQRGAFELLIRAPGLRFEHVPLATFGETLALCRVVLVYDGVAYEGGVTGPTDSSVLVLLEVDAAGRRVRTETFALDRLDAAITRAFERHAELLPAGPERTRAAGIAWSLAAMTGPLDEERYAAAIADDIEFADRRSLGLRPGRGRAGFLTGVRGLLAVVREAAERVDDVLAARPDALVLRWTNFGIERASEGRYERPFLLLLGFDAGGRLARWEQFDADHEARALARFDELAPPAPASRFANAVCRAQIDFDRGFRERDWDGLLARFAPGFRLIDHRPVVGVDLAGEAFLANLRLLLDTPSSAFRSVPIATRGERLALFRIRFSGEVGDGGTLVDEHLSLIEQDAAGRTVAVVAFDPTALEAAHAELDARHGAGEGATHGLVIDAMARFSAAYTARDWEGLASLLAPDVVLEDHRLLGWEALRGGPAWIAGIRSLIDLAPDARLRIDHARTSSHRFLCSLAWVGTRDGGPFESPGLIVVVLDDAGRFTRVDQYDPDQVEAAFARYLDDGARPAAPPLITNAATRVADAIDRAWQTRDWDAFAACFPPGFRRIDRRRMLQLELGRDEYLTMMRPIFGMAASHACSRVVGTRGAHLALVRVEWEGAEALVGPSEIAFVALFETDAGGALGTGVLFDVDQEEAAWAELDERFDAGEAAAHPYVPVTRTFSRAFAARDWDGLATVLAPELVVADHRRLGWDALRGVPAYVAALRSLVDLAPDVRLRLEHVIELRPEGVLYWSTWHGTREGGPFEEPSLIVAQVDASGRICRFDSFDLDQIAAARAHLARLARDEGGVSLEIPPNAAMRTFSRWAACAEARDWDGLESVFAADVLFDDRRRGIRMVGDRAMLLESVRVVARAGMRHVVKTLAITPERLTLDHVRLASARGDDGWEVEFLQLVRVDAAGRIVEIVCFDPEDRHAASAELFRRYVADEGCWIPPKASEVWLALHERDPARLRAALPPGFVFDDHRRTGVGRLEGRDAYLASVAAVWEQTIVSTNETVYALDQAPHGHLQVVRSFGTLKEGGAFESVFLRVTAFRDGYLAALDIFELNDLGAARACFEARRDPDRPRGD